MFPIAFRIPGTDVRLNYAISEIWLTQKYGSRTAVVMYGTEETEGELYLNVPVDQIVIEKGRAKKYDIGNGCSLICYHHGEPVIVRAGDVIFFIFGERMIGRVDTLKDGILMHNAYYLEDITETADDIRLKVQVKENTDTKFSFYPMNAEKTSGKTVMKETAFKLPLFPTGRRSSGHPTGNTVRTALRSVTIMTTVTGSIWRSGFTGGSRYVQPWLLLVQRPV